MNWAVELHGPNGRKAHLDVRVYDDRGDLAGEFCLDFKYTDKDGIVLIKQGNNTAQE